MDENSSFFEFGDIARQDKIDITIGDWYVRRCTATWGNEFLRFIGDSELLHPINRAFNRFSEITPFQKKTLKILKGTENNPNRPRPLFSGRVEITRRAEDPIEENAEVGYTFRIKLALSINPTRYCAYKTRRNPAENNSSNNPLWNFNLFTSRRITEHQGETSLDNSDNVLLTGMTHRYGGPTSWESSLRTYIEQIDEYFSYLLQRSTDICPGHHVFDRTHTYALTYLENYWEYFVDAPRILVNTLTSGLPPLLQNYSESTYLASVENQELSNSVKGNIGNGQTLKIYAKTNKRVRVEVASDIRRNPNISNTRSYTRETIDGVLDLINEIVEQNKRQCLSIFNELEEVESYPRILQLHPRLLIWDFYNYIDDSTIAKELLDIFITSGGISTRRVNDRYKEALKSLKRASVIERTSSKPYRYILHPRLSYAAQTLSDIW